MNKRVNIVVLIDEMYYVQLLQNHVKQTYYLYIRSVLTLYPKSMLLTSTDWVAEFTCNL